MKVFGDQRVSCIEANNKKLDKDLHANLGTPNHHTNITTTSKRNQIWDKKEISVEIQTNQRPSGVTPQIQR